MYYRLHMDQLLKLLITDLLLYCRISSHPPLLYLCMRLYQESQDLTHPDRCKRFSLLEKYCPRRGTLLSMTSYKLELCPILSAFLTEQIILLCSLRLPGLSLTLLQVFTMTISVEKTSHQLLTMFIWQH